MKYVSCSDSTDIKFQLGVLTNEQQKGIKNIGLKLEDYIGLTIRTEYDRTTARGKGFIYIAPDRGPNRYKSTPSNIEHWSLGNGGYLHKTLVHELGHVFGIPVVLTEKLDGGVTSPSYLSEVFKNSYRDIYSNVDFHLPKFFQYDDEKSYACNIFCGTADGHSSDALKIKEFFGLKDYEYIVAIASQNGQKISFHVHQLEKGDAYRGSPPFYKNGIYWRSLFKKSKADSELERCFRTDCRFC